MGKRRYGEEKKRLTNFVSNAFDLNPARVVIISVIKCWAGNPAGGFLEDLIKAVDKSKDIPEKVTVIGPEREAQLGEVDRENGEIEYPIPMSDPFGEYSPLDKMDHLPDRTHVRDPMVTSGYNRILEWKRK